MSDSNFLFYDYATSQVCKVKEDVKIMEPSVSIDRYLNSICLAHGSTLDGRRKAFSQLMSQKSYIPIVVSMHPQEIYFPIRAVNDPQNRWIRYEAIDKVVTQEKTCTIYFKDHTCLTCEYPNRIHKQMRQIFRFLKRRT